MQVPGEEGKFPVMWSYLPFNARSVPRSVMHVSRLFLHSRCLHSLWASSPGHPGSRAGKGRRACNYVDLWNLNNCIKKVDVKCWLVEMILVMTSLPLAHVLKCFFTFMLISALRWLAEIWQFSRRGAKGELEVEFKFQRRSCKLSFLFPPCHQSTLETLLTGYFLQGLTLCLLLLQNRIPDRNDAAAVQQFFMEEIQIGEDLIHQGLFSWFYFCVGGHFLCWPLGGYKKEQGWCKALTSSQLTRCWT